MVHWRKNILCYSYSEERGSLHVHSFLSIFNALNVENEAVCIEFFKPLDYFNDQDLFDLVKTYQVHAHFRTCWKYNKYECRFFYDQYLTEGTIIAKPLDSKFSNDEKQAILAWGNILLRQIKSYVYNNVNSVKLNAIY